MKKFFGNSPPFSAFLVETNNTGRVMIIENSNMGGAGKQCTDSG